jgi:hypothetical protein
LTYTNADVQMESVSLKLGAFGFTQVYVW